MKTKPTQQYSQYRSQLLKQFSQLYYKYNDLMQNITESIPMPNPHREEILFREYDIEKKGKNLGTTEMRRARIQDSKLVQRGQKQQKQFPNPTHISKSPKSHRLHLHFPSRTPISILPKNPEQQTQLHLFFHTQCHPEYKQSLQSAFTRIYKQKVVAKFLERLLNVRMSKTYNVETVEKRKLSVLSGVKNLYTDRQLIRNFVYKWQAESMRVRVPVSNAQKLECVMNVKDIVSQIGFEIHEVSTVPGAISQGAVKLWVGQVTHEKIIKFGKDNLKVQQYPNLTSPIQQVSQSYKKYNQTELSHRFVINNGDIKLRNQMPPLSIWTTLQFQVQSASGGDRLWRSQRMSVLDLVRAFSRGVLKTVILHNSTSTIQLCLTAKHLKCPLLQIQIPPQHQSFPSSYTYKLTPKLYPSLCSLIPQSILLKYIKSISKDTLHLQYTIAYQEYVLNCNVQAIGFGGIARIAQLIGVQALIDKFTTMEMYANLDGSRGTQIYEMLLKKAEKFSFYDAEKYAWKYPNSNMTRLLSVIKTFDQSPRINLTQPFQSLCLQILKLCQKQSLLKLNPNSKNFDVSTSLGREALAFFIILGIIKNSTSLLLHHNNCAGRMAIAANTLLFHYVFKKYVGQLYFRIIGLSINIQAVFGQYLVSLFSSLFNIQNGNTQNYSSSTQTYLFILTQYLTQRKSHHQPPNPQAQQSHSHRHSYCLSLISCFLSILQLFQLHLTETSPPKSTPSAYQNAKNYLFQLNHFASILLEKYYIEFTQLYQKYYDISHTVLDQDDHYKQLFYNLDKFLQKQYSQSNLNDMNLGELMEQLYAEFNGYKHKNQADIRKISIIIDHLQLSQQQTTPKPHNNSYQGASLTIQVFQNSLKLYEHQYILPSQQNGFPILLSFPALHHNIQLKLSRLSPLVLVFTSTICDCVKVYKTVLDPLAMPSNIYMQVFRELEASLWQPYMDRYALLQIYIKDSVDADGLQNYIPDGYVNGLLLSHMLNQHQPKNQLKKDIIFSNHYFRSFRLMQCNFNLLYAKLGWYGNHYKIPTNRLHSIQIHKQHQQHQQQQQHLSNSTLFSENTVSQLSPAAFNQLTQLMFYTRCVYGRAILPSIGYTNCQCNLTVETIRDQKCIKEYKNMNYFGDGQFNSCANLMCYLLDNFNYHGQGSANQNENDFLEFYLKATNQLPLLRYLTFRPLQFYLLQQITLNIKVFSQSSQPQPQKSSSLHSLPVPKSSSSCCKTYKIVLTNHPILPNPNNPSSPTHAYPFLCSSQILPQNIYNGYEEDGQNRGVHDTKALYHKLVSKQEIPNTMYFTMPNGIHYHGSGGLADGVAVIGGVTATVDQLMYLIQVNVMHYYGGTSQQEVEGKDKIKNKGKDKQKNSNADAQVLGCIFTPKFPNTTLHNLYSTLYQTKQPLQISVHPILPIPQSSTKLPSPTSSSSTYPSPWCPIILNQLHRHYTSFAYLCNVWNQVCILCRIVTPSFEYFFVEQQQTRKRRLIKSSDMILGLQTKKMMHFYITFKFTDQEVVLGKDCVKKQLLRVL